MSIFDKVSDMGRGLSEKASNVSEVSNLKRKILYEEERIVEIFADLGKKYYKNPDEDPSVFRALCDDIDARRRRIKKMKFELNTLRGYKMCPKCDAENSEKNIFCGVCGARLPDPETDFLNLCCTFRWDSAERKLKEGGKIRECLSEAALRVHDSAPFV